MLKANVQNFDIFPKIEDKYFIMYLHSLNLRFFSMEKVVSSALKLSAERDYHIEKSTTGCMPGYESNHGLLLQIWLPLGGSGLRLAVCA